MASTHLYPYLDCLSNLMQGGPCRVGGHLKPDVFNRIGNLAKEYGLEAAAEVAAFEMEHVSVIEDLVKKEKIDCDLEVNRVCDIQFDKDQLAKVKAGYDYLVSQGVETIKDVGYTPPELAETVCHILHTYIPKTARLTSPRYPV